MNQPSDEIASAGPQANFAEITREGRAIGDGMKLVCAGMTDVGNARDHNEDDFYLSDGDEALYIVADGMGGHRSGEVASAMAIKSMVEYYRKTMPADGAADVDVDEAVDFDRERLVEAVQAANTAVFEAASGSEIYRGMGTTIVSGYFTDHGLCLAHIGDSRAYRLRDGELEQQTVDHSLANEYVEMGILAEEEVRYFPYKNVITRACGLGEEVEVTSDFHEIAEGDVYLFCSDGLTDMVRPERIEEMLNEDDELDVLCKQLVDEANGNGGDDNVTVILARIDDAED